MSFLSHYPRDPEPMTADEREEHARYADREAAASRAAANDPSLPDHRRRVEAVSAAAWTEIAADRRSGR